MKVHLNGIDLAYSDEGQGHPMVFLHAFPLNRTMWDPQMAALKDHYRVITIDLRGHGESDAPMWRYTMEQFADDIIALLQHLSIPQATFVGLSMGGYILFALYRKYPEYVRALVLADTRAQADTPEGKATRFSMAQVAHRRGACAIAELMLPKLLSPSGIQQRTELITKLRNIILGNPPSGIIGDLMAMEERPDASSLARTLNVPTLVVVGEHDIPSPPAEMKELAKLIPGATLKIIPQAGHVSNLENPEAFNQALLDFLAKG